MVLMKNITKFFHKKSQKMYCSYRPLADNAENMQGTWSVAAKHKDTISFAGLKQTFGNSVNFTYAKGSNVDYDATFEQTLQCLAKNTYRDSRNKEEMLKRSGRCS